ncbi:MAG: helix-turn-helix transcriptional regulator [Bacteroidales bacterium]|nr:helix-turn-helix transcriptional regulator [Bacteroidales bacterium]
MVDDINKWQPPKQVDEEHAATIKEVGEKLKKLRERTGLKSSAFAKELGISRNSYSQMERGEIYFSLRNLLIIINHHGLDLKKFIETDLENL